MAESPTFMAGLSERAVQRVAGLGRIRHYRPGEHLLRQGAAVDDVIVIETGLVKVVTGADGGEEIILDLRGPGDVIGEMSAIDGAPRSATVTALLATSARRIRAESFLAALAGDVELNLGLLCHLVRHLRDSDRSRLQYVAAPAFERIAAVLEDFAVRHGERQPDGRVVVARGLSHQELADAAAVSLPVFSRCLRVLRRAGVVSTGRRRALMINDLALLRRMTPPNMS